MYIPVIRAKPIERHIKLYNVSGKEHIVTGSKRVTIGNHVSTE